jgi:hypothetical protein
MVWMGHGVMHALNFDMPRDEENYVHRIMNILIVLNMPIILHTQGVTTC